MRTDTRAHLAEPVSCSQMNLLVHFAESFGLIGKPNELKSNSPLHVNGLYIKRIRLLNNDDAAHAQRLE